MAQEVISQLRIVLFGLPLHLVGLGILVIVLDSQKYHSLMLKVFGTPPPAVYSYSDCLLTLILGGLLLAVGALNLIAALIAYIIVISKLNKLKKVIVYQIEHGEGTIAYFQ